MVTGIFGLLLILNGSIVAATAMVKEREAGTIEQLLMSPAGTYEIIIAKIAPLFFLLFLMVLFATALIKVVFDVPFHGNILVVLAGAALVRALRHRHRNRDRDLHAFGLSGAVDQLLRQSAAHHASGAITPAEAMPGWLQPLVRINPIRHFSVIARSSMIKGSGFETLWPNFLVLSIFTLIMVSLSVWRFRKMLS